MALTFDRTKERSSIPVVFLLFLLALAAAFVSNAVVPDSLRQDSPSDYNGIYVPIGQSIAEGKGIVMPDGDIALRVPPGYPVILAGGMLLANLFGMQFPAMMYILNIILFGLSAVVLYLTARVIWPGWLAVIPALLWIGYPFSLWLTQAPNVEVPFFIFLFGAVGLLFRAYFGSGRRRLFYFLAGLSIGIAMLIRPIAVGLGVVFALLILLFKTRRSISYRLLAALVLLAGNLLAVFWWEAWVYSQTGRVIMLSSSDTSSIRDGLTFGVDDKGYRNDILLPGGAVQVMEQLQANIPRKSPTSLIVREMSRAAADNPVGFAQFLLVKAARSWYGTDSGRGENLILLIQAPLVALTIISFYLMIKSKSVPTAAWATLLACILYFWMMTVIVVPILRYMVPVVGLAFLAFPAVVLPLQRRVFRKSTHPTKGMTL